GGGGGRGVGGGAGRGSTVSSTGMASPKFTLVALLTSGPIAFAQDAGRFADLTLDAAIARARTGSLAVLIDFSTPGCEPCRRLNATWAEPGVVEWIGQHAIAIRVDPERDQDLARKQPIDAYPTVVLLRPDGTE